VKPVCVRGKTCVLALGIILAKAQKSVPSFSLRDYNTRKCPTVPGSEKIHTACIK